MKKIFLLFVVLTDPNGFEQMHVASNIKHTSYLSCKVEQKHHTDLKDKIAFFCADEARFFNKEQKLF